MIKKEIIQKCELCSTALDNTCRAIAVGDPLRVSKETFFYRMCSGCGTWIQTPRPIESEMAPFYAEGFYPDQTGSLGSPIRRLACKLRDLHLYYSEVGWILNYLDEGCNYLDYSTGDGQVIRQISRLRPDVQVYGTEYSPTFREWNENQLQDGHLKADIGGFPVDLRFDVISVLGVIEHVQSPTAMIRVLAERLKPGGVLLLMAPNPRSFQKTLSGSKWAGWLAPRHMYLMNMQTMLELLEREGFHPIRKRHFFCRYSPGTLVQSFFPNLAPVLCPKYFLPLFGVLFYCAMPIEWIASWVGRSGFMGVAAEKRS